MKQVNNEIQKRILDIAQAEFFNYGFSKISMDEIANKLGMSKRTLYQYFPSKKELLFAVMERKMSSVSASITAIMESNKNVAEKIRGISKVFPQELSEISKVYFEDIQRNMPDLWQRIDEFRTKMGVANFKKLINEGQKQGIIRPDINETIFTYMLISVIRGVITPDVLVNNPFSIEDVINFVTKIFWEGIFTEEGRKKYLLSNQRNA